MPNYGPPHMGLSIGFAYGMRTFDGMESIGERIRARRKALKLNQEQLGAQVGVDQSVISDIERHDAGFSAATLMNLARALMVTPEDIMEGGDPDARMQAELLGAWRLVAPDEKRSVLSVAQAFARSRDPEPAAPGKRRANDR
jgi:transcriptional regulator with XRE-family HTH domain